LLPYDVTTMASTGVRLYACHERASLNMGALPAGSPVGEDAPWSTRHALILPSLCPVHTIPLAPSTAAQRAGGTGTDSLNGAASSSPRRCGPALGRHPRNASWRPHIQTLDSAPAHSCRRRGSHASVRKKAPTCVSRSGCGRAGCIAARSGTRKMPSPPPAPTNSGSAPPYYDMARSSAAATADGDIDAEAPSTQAAKEASGANAVSPWPWRCGNDAQRCAEAEAEATGSSP